MDNNNMDNFFRQHSNTMDETPGDALWQRIERQLPLVTTVPKSSKISFSGSKFLLVLMVTATMIVAGIVFIRNNNKGVLKPAVTTSTNTVMSETAIEQDTVKKKKPVKDATSKEQAPPFRRIQKKTITKPEQATILLPASPKDNTVKSEVIPEPKVIKTTLVYHPKRTVITINEVVSQHVFDSITAANIEKYKNNAGMQLIVKEPRSGHIFRTTFEKNVTTETLIFRPKQTSNQVEVVKFSDNKRNGNPVKVNLDSVKIQKSTFKVQTIKFKPDSIAH